jgi:hypothetical protein
MHLVTPSSRITPPLRKEIPMTIAFHADLWLTVRLHPKYHLLSAGKLIVTDSLICKTKNTEWKIMA